MLLRRFCLGVGTVCFLAAVAVGGRILWESIRKPAKWTLPEYQLSEPTSPTYWADRTQWAIDWARDLSRSDGLTEERLRTILLRELGDAKRIDAVNNRVRAVGDIALTMSRNDVDINIDDALRSLEESELTPSIRGRVLISQALMHLRLGNPTAARVAVMEYHRIVVASDLKLDSDVNEMSFFGATTVLGCLEDTTGLNEMFKRNIAFTPRIETGLQMKAYRIIAGEQARAGFALDAMNTLPRIRDALERARAIQVIVSCIARPKPFQPTEPEMTMPPTDASRDPLPNPTAARRIVEAVLGHVASYPKADDQLDVLLRIAGSRLMCDPEIYEIFKAEFSVFPTFPERVKRPVLKLLDQPESETIRTALKMPPLPEASKKVVDPALDDWTSSWAAPAVEAANIDPETIRAANRRQELPILRIMAQSYIRSNRRADAVRVLRDAFRLADAETRQSERIDNLLAVAEQQFQAGAVSEAYATLQAIAPSGGEETAPSGFSEARLSELAKLLVVGRYFDDALKVIERMSSEPARDAEYAFLISELIRIRHLDRATSLIGLMGDGPRRRELEHLLGAAQGGGAEHYRALNLDFPGALDGDADLARCCERLIRRDLFGPAEQCAKRIGDPEIRSALLSRIVREYMLLFSAYRDEDESHRTVREELLGYALHCADAIDIPHRQADALERIVAAARPYAVDESRRKRLDDLVERALELVRRSDAPPVAKAELSAKLIASRIVLESSQRSEIASWPLIDRDKEPERFQAVKKRIDEAITFLNESDDLVECGPALSLLAASVGRIGLANGALVLIREAEEAAEQTKDMNQSISVFLSLAPTLQSLGDNAAARAVLRKALLQTSKATSETPDSANAAADWQKRDAEIERIVLAQIEHGFFSDALAYAVRVESSTFTWIRFDRGPLLRDRLLFALTYIQLDRKEYETAETVARKIGNAETRRAVLQDIRFVRRATKPET